MIDIEEEVKNRTLIAPMGGCYIAKLYGCGKKHYFCRNGEIFGKALCKAKEYFGYDIIHLSSDIYVEVEAMGLYSWSCIYKEYGKMNENFDIDSLTINLNSGRVSEYRKAIEYCNSKNNTVFVSVSAPFTLAAIIRGIDRFMIDLIKNKKFAKDLIKKTTEISKIVIEDIKDIAYPFVVDAVASSSLISPEFYREFAFKPVKKVLKLCDFPILHMCGDINPILDDIKKTGSKVISFDDNLEISKAFEVFNDLIVFGNINPSMMYHSNVDWVKTEVKKCMESKTGDYILSTGCSIPVGTPKENLKTLVRYGRCYDV
ncbi:uroporphyrinogen decarboxylase family protein [Methanotorris igneus]|uniref:Uroporphyrinogen decarboxylase (URO-D) n=1 Tax=Methanotorris igneus (strain DSM 5666 / JCM 11834 / Kol 5) TaxID=880724 RepID=F6BCL4_METIK|nr:uroporphyrinogen decarboxylase family protein [Methanotorris igneus]AEF96225.1 Uroporphyrinogen decarboxylase (URO-D) [Methanotorris igneus Kol 5]